jgi:hypothetical protein
VAPRLGLAGEGGGGGVAADPCIGDCSHTDYHQALIMLNSYMFI